jgi:peroxiredoxin
MGSRWGKTMLESGAVAPEFRLRNTSGGIESLSALVANGPVLLAFYKASCPVCQLTLPYLQRIKDSGIRVVCISQDDEETTRAFVKAFRITSPVLLDEAGNGYPASNAYGIFSVPSLFQVDPGGTITHAWAGWSKADMLALGERARAEVVKEGEQVPVLRPG